MTKPQLLKLPLLILLCACTSQQGAAQPDNQLLQQLRADYEKLQSARIEFDQAENSGKTSPQEQADYAAWVDQLSEQFAHSCRIFSQLSDEPVPADIPCEETISSQRVAADINIAHESTDDEKNAAIVDQFNDSLGEFDEKLLREQDRVKENKPRTAATSAGGAGADGGSDGGSDGQHEQESTGGSSAAEETGDQKANDNDQTSSGGPGRPSGANPDNTPDDIPDGSNDDVIARQLREAAEKENDPELREKLWEEYRRYKSGN